MRNMGRAAAGFCVLAVCALGCSSSKTKGGGGSAGSNPFGNVTTTSGGGGTGSGAGAGTGNGATGVPGAGGCARGTAHASRVIPRVVLLVDGSCSMSSDYPSSGRDATSCQANPNGRWAAIRKALIDPQTGVVTQLQGVVEFGLAVFGTQPTCPIPNNPVPLALNNLQAIQASLPDVQPGMFTPTGPALDWVYTNMFDLSATPDQQVGPQLLVLATDGEPNDCTLMGGFGGGSTNFQPSIDAVTKGIGMGIRTSVISLAASNGQFHDFLQQLANIGAAVPQGGMNAPLYEPTTPDELAADLQLLIGGAVGCDVALNGSVVMGRECEGTVTINGNKIPCDSPDGWILPDPRHIRLQGSACDTLKSSPDALLDASFPCGVFAVQ